MVSIKYQSEMKEEGFPGFFEYLKDYCQCPEKVRVGAAEHESRFTTHGLR